MSSQTQNYTKGFTLIEILIAITVMISLVAIVSNIFLSFDRHQALDRDTAKVISVLEKARQLTLFSKEASQYGVRLETSQIILFKGDMYQAGASNNSLTKLHSKVSISAYNLNGGGDDVVFERLTGETDQDGSITLQSTQDLTKTKTINIEKTGLIR
jgi:prepilin-type N-terminal cleavage/methylation domain-containing protein